MISKLLSRIRLKLGRRRQMTSNFLRDYFLQHHDVRVGMYSYGCFDASRVGSGTVIGRYCSVAPTAHILRRNHGVSAISMHPFLYNESIPFPVKENIEYNRCEIEDDVWLGHASIILPSVVSIGRGAVIAAGAVVTKDVPRYAIVAGNPARILKMRFSPEVIEKIESTRWWELSLEEFSEFCMRNRSAVFSPHLLERVNT